MALGNMRELSDERVHKLLEHASRVLEVVLHTAYAFSNETDSLFCESYVGLDESGFESTVKDWLDENLPLLLVVAGSVVTIIACIIFVVLLRKHRFEAAKEPLKKDAKEPPSG